MELRQNSNALIIRQIAIDINYNLQFDGKIYTVSELRQNSSSEAKSLLIKGNHSSELTVNISLEFGIS